jgi:hypothetical protein
MTSRNVSVPPRASSTARRLTVFVLLLAALCALAFAAQSPPADAIGNIEGDDLLVQGAPNEAMVVKQGVTPLDSGASITVRTGQALIQLGDGGEIGVCGPAHFSVLQSGNALTLALDYGRVHPKLPPSTSVVIYTALIAATPIAIGQQQRDIVVGLAADGAMCVTSSQGAVRIAQQLSDESVIVPEGGAISLAGGALAPAGPPGSCSCEVQLARNAPPPPPSENPPAVETAEAPPPSQLSAPLRPADSAPPALPPPVASPTPSGDNQPIYQVFMPPLTFDANSPSSSTDPSPQMILIVRHARVHAGAVFSGVVEAEALPVSSSPASSASAAQAQQTPGGAAAARRPGVYQRVRNYLRNLFGKPS